MNRLGVEDLSEEQSVNAAKVIVKSCMNVKSGEKVLLIVQNDEKRKLVGKYLEAEVRRLRAIPAVIFVEDSEMKAEPPKRVVDAMMTSDVILATLNLDNTQIIAHTKARNVATNEKKARFGMAPALLANITYDDIMKIRERTEKVARIMESGKIARITGPDGTGPYL